MDVFPPAVPGSGAHVVGTTVYVDGVAVATAPTTGDALILWVVSLFVFSLRYPRARSTGRFLAHYILDVEDEPPKDRVSKNLKEEVHKLLSLA